MKPGAEPKKVAILIGLLVVAAAVYYTNSQDEELERARAVASNAPRQAAAPQAAVATRPAEKGKVAPAAPRRPGSSGPRSVQEFRPSLKPRRAEDRPDPATVDPTLRLELLAKLQDVKMEGGDRSLFEFSQPPPPKQPDPPKIIPKGADAAKDSAKPAATDPPKDVKPAKPPPPPITLKFYGLIGGPKQVVKRAFFLDGDEIMVGAEGELIKKRYKIVRIGLNSVVVEDTQYKHQQTLVLEEQQTG
jgi:hypothetical protein